MYLYLGGKMVGIPGLGFEAFDEGAALLRILGHTVFNPADHDRDNGFDPGNEYLGTYADIDASGFNRREALRADLNWIMLNSQAMILVDENWVTSPGTIAEIAAHQSIFLPVFMLTDFLQFGMESPQIPPLVATCPTRVMADNLG
jgi:Domain of unknown function (DUF4406)